VTKRAGRGRSDREPRPDREPEPDADPYAVARTIVLNRLTAAPRTRAELATTLKQRGTPDDVAVAVLDRMVEVGLVDDAEFAREWVRQRQQGRGLARRALGDELRRKGVADDLAREALDTVDDDAERIRAVELARRKARASRGQPHDKRVRSLAGMLARKGYGPAVAYAVVREVLADEGADTDLADPDVGESGLLDQ
jgi:regulatory protein